MLFSIESGLPVSSLPVASLLTYVLSVEFGLPVSSLPVASLLTYVLSVEFGLPVASLLTYVLLVEFGLPVSSLYICNWEFTCGLWSCLWAISLVCTYVRMLFVSFRRS